MDGNLMFTKEVHLTQGPQRRRGELGFNPGSVNNDDTGHQLMSPEPGTEPGTWHFLSSYSLLTGKGKVPTGVDGEVSGTTLGQKAG